MDGRQIVETLEGRMMLSAGTRAGYVPPRLDRRDAAIHVAAHATSLATSPIVDDGTTQRSHVRSITLPFGQMVTIAPGAFQLVLLITGGSGADDGSAPTDASAALGTPFTTNGGSTWVVPFLAGTAFSDPTGSLQDGIYTLNFDPNAITFQSTGQHPSAYGGFTFHRLYGDKNGSGTVNVLDYSFFRSTYGRASGDEGYNALFDFDGNGAVNLFDYAEFRHRFTKVTFTYTQ